jgi:hypothetical protein
MKENINEHDMTKKMMSVIREFGKTLIKEDDAPATASVPKPIFEKGDDLPDEPEEEKMAEAPAEGPQPLFPIDDSYEKLAKNDERFTKVNTAIEGLKLGIRITSIYIKPKTENFSGDIVITGEKTVNDANKFEFTISYTQGMKSNSASDGDLNEEELKTGLNGYLTNLQNDPKTDDDLFYDVKK